MRHAPAAVLALLVLSAALAGCFGGAQEEVRPTATLRPKEITEEAQTRFEELVQEVPSNYTFPLQRALAPAVAWLNGTVDFSANLAVEGNSDQGGNNLNPVIVTQDFTSFLPPGQPAEIHVKLFYYGNPGQSADLDIFVDVPGRKGSYDPGTSQDMNWNIVVKRAVINTVGVEGQPVLLGVQASNGKLLPVNTLDFFMEVAFHYAQDVLTPFHPWAFTLPEGATGVVLRSVKVAGDEHVRSGFVIIGPADEAVAFIEYDDIAIPTESVFIPLRQPGEYVFYAYWMNGGFFSLKADTPVEARAARPLPLREESAIDFNGALAPGVAEHDVLGDGTVVTPYTEGARTPGFAVDSAFPLRITGTLEPGVAGDVEMRIVGPKGLVFQAQRTARADLPSGSVGLSGDHWPFVMRDPSALAKGSYTVSVVVNGYTGQLGHTVLTYTRGA